MSTQIAILVILLKLIYIYDSWPFCKLHSQLASTPAFIAYHRAMWKKGFTFLWRSFPDPWTGPVRCWSCWLQTLVKCDAGIPYCHLVALLLTATTVSEYINLGKVSAALKQIQHLVQHPTASWNTRVAWKYMIGHMSRHLAPQSNVFNKSIAIYCKYNYLSVLLDVLVDNIWDAKRAL